MECQKMCQIKCHKICQIECQKICHIDWQKVCQKICRIERPKEVCQSNGLEHMDKEQQMRSQIEYKIMCVEFEWMACFADAGELQHVLACLFCSLICKRKCQVTFESEAADRLATSQTKRVLEGSAWYLCNNRFVNDQVECRKICQQKICYF